MKQIRLDAKNITQKFGSATILSNISLSFFPGEFVGLLGPSGAGKSTLLKGLCGIFPPSKGEIYVNGKLLKKHQDQLRYFMGYVPQDDIVHRSLSVYKALYYSGLLRFPEHTPRDEIKKRVDELIRQLGLWERRDTPIKKLSGGQRKRVSIGVELLIDSYLLFLDEPTSGLDPALEEQMMQLFKKLASGGRIVLLTTHMMESLSLLDVIVILVKGNLVYFGPAKTVRNYFKVDDYSDIYKLLNQKNPKEWAEIYRRSSLYNEYVVNRLNQPCTFPLPELAVPPPPEKQKQKKKEKPQETSKKPSTVEDELERMKRDMKK